MPFLLDELRRRAAATLIVVGLTAGSFVTLAQAQSSTRGYDARSVHRYGHTQTAARRLTAERVGLPDAAYLETLDDTDVLHYALEIEISNLDPANNTCTITGSNTMTIQSKSALLSEFTFRLRHQYNITGAYIDGLTPVTVTTVSDTTRVVTLDRTYGLNDVFTLTIEYTGDSVSAAFGSIEVDTHSDSIPVVATLSEPYYAYTWWPVKDGDLYQPGDNSDKATLDFSITVPDNFTVPSNGLLQGVDTLSGSRKRYRWASDYPITTYLVSFAATEYNTWTVDYNHPGGTMPVEFYIYPSRDTTANRAAWEKVIDMLETLRPLFGEYPFIDEKYGIYNFPFGGGMEHQTITGQSGFSEWLTVHELAHQWWGDMITCKTWNHIWLNEGFASYTEALWFEHKPGSSGLPALKNYMAGMKYTDGGSVYVYDDEVDELWEIFNGNTSYHKGAWVLHMLRHVLGDEDFFDALAAYRAAFEYGAATTEDFQAVCENFYEGGNLGWFFQEWIYGEWAPAYAWGWKSVQVSGNHYLLLYIIQTQPTTYPQFTMPIDIVVDGTTYVVFNDADAEHFVIPIPSAPTTVCWTRMRGYSGVTAGRRATCPGHPRSSKRRPRPARRWPPRTQPTPSRSRFIPTSSQTSPTSRLLGRTRVQSPSPSHAAMAQTWSF